MTTYLLGNYFLKVKDLYDILNLFWKYIAQDFKKHKWRQCNILHHNGNYKGFKEMKKKKFLKVYNLQYVQRTSHVLHGKDSPQNFSAGVNTLNYV